jgi:hypothetical protein
MHIRYLRDPLCAIAMIGLAIGPGCGGVNHQAPPDARADAAGDATGGVPDALPPDAIALPDAAVARCDPSKPFGTPTPVAGVNSTARDQGAKLVDDLTIYFGSDRGGTAGLYVATRSSPTTAFGTPTALAAINATGAATGPTLTGDRLTMYYALVAPAGQTGDLYVTGRVTPSAAFSPGTIVTGINSSLDDLDPFVTEDGSALYFDSARDGVALHLYVALRLPSGAFGAPQALTALNTQSVDGHPVVSHDGLTIYWSSTRTDGGAQGGTDIWRATRTSTAGAFASPVRVAELSSTANESPSWISPDNCMVLLQSDRANGVGLQDIYQAVRPL